MAVCPRPEERVDDDDKIIRDDDATGHVNAVQKRSARGVRPFSAISIGIAREFSRPPPQHIMLRPVDLIYTLLAILQQPVHSQDINTLARKIHHKNGTASPIEIYVSYTNNPWGSSAVLQETGRAGGKTEQYRPKRSVYQLYNMVVCATGCNPLSYLGYGCYCGFLGSGSPVDPIDNCCKMHDWCYDSADCPMFLEYFTPYVWTCYNKKPLCSLGGGCSQRLCECDRQLAVCLRRYGCPTQKAPCKTSPWRWFQNVLF